MKFVSVRDLRNKPGEVWKVAKQENDLVVTSNGRPVAIITGVDEDNFEEELDTIQRARALKALDTIQNDSIIKGTAKISDEDIRSEIERVRKGKRV